MLPDLATLVKRRLAEPRPMTINADPAEMGRAVLRQLEPDSAPGGEIALRMSSLGKCARALSYKYNGVPENGRKIDGRARATFAMGDMAEILLTSALADALTEMEGWSLGDYREDGQASVELEVNGHIIKGHPDGTIIGPDGTYLLEVKSASSYGFSTWQKALEEGREPWTPEEGYYFQIQAYMMSLKVDRAYVLVLGKDSGAIMGWWTQRDPRFTTLLEKHLRLATSTNPETVPRLLPSGKPITPVSKLSKRTGAPLKGHGALPWNCTYCSHFRTCYGPRLEERVETDYRGRPSMKLYLG